MNLIAKPKLIAIDNSIIGKIAKDFYSDDLEKHKRASTFINISIQKSIIPIICFHHIAEIIQYENNIDANKRLSLFSKFPQVAWIKCVSKNSSLGSIIDIQGTEIELIIKFQKISLSEIQETVKNKIVRYSSGEEFVKKIYPEYQLIKDLNLLNIQKGKAIDSISHISDEYINNQKLSVLKTSRLRTTAEAIEVFKSMKNKYIDDLKCRGDKKLVNHEGIVDYFLSEVWDTGKNFYNDSEAPSLYSSFLKAFGVDESYVNEDWTVGELGYLAIFINKIKLLSKTFQITEKEVLKNPFSHYPSWHIWVELDKRIRKEEHASGSNIIDKYLASLALYADILIADKRIKEYFRQITKKGSAYSSLRKRVIKCSNYLTMIENI